MYRMFGTGTYINSICYEFGLIYGKAEKHNSPKAALGELCYINQI